MTSGECVLSIFCLHNETLNIWTHGLAFIYVLVVIPDFLPLDHPNSYIEFLSWCHLFSAISPWIGSFFYHVFMNVNYDETMYKCLLKIDMLGIWICQSFGAIPMVVASVHCSSNVLWHACVWMYWAVSIWGLLKAMNARSPWERRVCFLPPFVMRILTIGLRLSDKGGGNPEALTHIILQDFLSILGGTIGAFRVPEKWMPGKFDFILNSHNVMHVLVVFAVFSMHCATVQDLAWMSNSTVCTANDPTSPHNHQEF